MSEWVFWSSLLLVIYPHILYPALLLALSGGRRKACQSSGGTSGPVAIVCSVYNEQSVIASKIDNFYQLNYRPLELYLGLDGCTDNTLAEIRRVAIDDRVKVFVYPRGGKVSVLNALLREVKEPLVVMSDANSMYRPDAVGRLVSHLTDGVGLVCGRLVLVDESGQSGEGIYWRMETALKKAESVFGSVVGANGAIYLFRRELFEPLPPDTINDDFSISMRIYARGHDIVYADDAIAEELQVTTDAEEFRRHIRDAAGHFRALALLWPLLNPLRGKRFFFYVSHRVLRWMGPFLILAILFTNVALAWHHPPWRVLLAVQGTGYLVMGLVHVTGLRWRLLYVPYYFLLVNLAILIGFMKNLLGLQKTSWVSTRR